MYRNVWNTWLILVITSDTWVMESSVNWKKKCLGSKHPTSTCLSKAIHGKKIEFLDFDGRRLAFGGYNLTSTCLLTFTSGKVGMTFKLQWVWSGIMTVVSSGNVVRALLGPSCQLSGRVSSGRQRGKGGVVVAVVEKGVGEGSWSWQGPGSEVARPGIAQPSRTPCYMDLNAFSGQTWEAPFCMWDRPSPFSQYLSDDPPSHPHLLNLTSFPQWSACEVGLPVSMWVTIPDRTGGRWESCLSCSAC